MNPKMVARQRLRQAGIIGSFLLFPLIMNYFSPYLIVDSASQGILNGSAVVFLLLFLSALFVGRLWCSWACPAGGLGEIGFAINQQPVNGKKLDRIKWVIWAVWLSLIAGLVIAAGGYHTVDLFIGTQQGISVAGTPDRPIAIAYIIYYFVVGLFLSLSIFVGRRAGCHAVCWMAPFMIAGRKLRNRFHWASLRLQATPESCSSCLCCTTHYPMSLDVNQMVHSGTMEHSECILCGTCIDGCPHHVIHYSFSSGKPA